MQYNCIVVFADSGSASGENRVMPSGTLKYYNTFFIINIIFINIRWKKNSYSWCDYEKPNADDY